LGIRAGDSVGTTPKEPMISRRFSATEFWKAQNMPLCSDNALRCLNVPFDMLSFSEAAADPVFPPFNFVEFPL
jgi:hypothetical protein